MFVQQGSEIRSQNITGDTSWFNFDFCVHQDIHLMAACRHYCWSLPADIRLVDRQLRRPSPVSAADVNLLYLIHFTLGTRVVWPHLSLGLQPLLHPRLWQHAVHTCGLFSNISERRCRRVSEKDKQLAVCTIFQRPFLTSPSVLASNSVD